MNISMSGMGGCGYGIVSINNQEISVDGKVIGVITELYTDTYNKAKEYLDEKDKYYNMLVEHGILEKKKTTDDIIEEQSQIIKKLNEQVNKSSEAIEKLLKKIDEKEKPSKTDKAEKGEVKC